MLFEKDSKMKDEIGCEAANDELLKRRWSTQRSHTEGSEQCVTGSYHLDPKEGGSRNDTSKVLDRTRGKEEVEADKLFRWGKQQI